MTSLTSSLGARSVWTGGTLYVAALCMAALGCGNAPAPGQAPARDGGTTSVPCVEPEGSQSCVPGDTRARNLCSGGVLRGTEPCASGEVCLGQGLCVSVLSGCAGRADGSRVCSGGIPATCTDQGTRTVPGEACADATPVCSEGSCIACTEGARVCRGDSVARCDAAGALIDEEACDIECSNAKCQTTCTPGRRRCEGAGMDETLGERRAVQTCGADGAFRLSQVCWYDCWGSGGDVLCRDCEPGTRACHDGSVRTCDGSGFWEKGETCTRGCSQGACVPVCTVGARICNGQELLECVSSDAWDVKEVCPVGCYAGACVECAPLSLACDVDGVSRRVCGNDGRYRPLDRCTSRCVDGQCVGLAP